MNKVLVTGGTGFIGSHLCKFLLEKGDKVICIDNFLTGKKENIQELIGNPNFKLIEADINETIQDELLKNLDEIYNLACPASPIHYQNKPIETIKGQTQ